MKKLADAVWLCRVVGVVGNIDLIAIAEKAMKGGE